MLNKDYTTIDDEIRQNIVTAIKEDLGAETVFVCKDSDHPDDWYLYLYIAKRGDEYIAGLANISRESVGLYDNHYGCTFKEAVENLSERIHESHRYC